MGKYEVSIRISGPARGDDSFPLESAGTIYSGSQIPDKQRDLDLPPSAASEDRLKPVGPVSADPPPKSGRNRGINFGDLPAHESRGIGHSLRTIDAALKLSRTALILAEIDNSLQADKHFKEDEKALSEELAAKS